MISIKTENVIKITSITSNRAHLEIMDSNLCADTKSIDNDYVGIYKALEISLIAKYIEKTKTELWNPESRLYLITQVASGLKQMSQVYQEMLSTLSTEQLDKLNTMLSSSETLKDPQKEKMENLFTAARKEVESQENLLKKYEATFITEDMDSKSTPSTLKTA